VTTSDANIFTCTREDIKTTLDVQETAYANARIDRAVGAGSRAVEGQMRRRFYPWTGTRKFDWPQLPTSGAYPWRIWFDQFDLISATACVSGGATIPIANLNFEPVNDGPPYTHVEINLGSSSSFSAGATWQQSTLFTGLWGYSADTTPGGTLAAIVSSASSTTITLSDSAAVGVGSILLVDSERMLVTAKNMVTTALTLQTDMAASAAAGTLATTNGAAFQVGETLLLDGERMLIQDIAGNNLIVKRAWDGSTLAAHTGAVVIYAARTATVTRGALGTTAATHSNAAPISVHQVPDLIRTLTVAEALCNMLGEEAGWARMVGSGDNARPAPGGGIKDLRAQVANVYARQARQRAV
jgi:hypothetical protein